MTIQSILGAIVIGAVIGAIGRLLLPGRQAIGWILTIVVGIVAALIGTLIAQVVGVETTPGIDWIELVLQVVLAVVGVGIVAGLRRGPRGSTRI
ncbi:GlsB/YeaQ/YmgE family stress response membrane protein [Nonomuraea sp. CA-218870]|uniref:GlsB/YeaQ/YmgE family stress response membrane protein n=1 Tax=Nonomuraea sp. CA-218870 TaxID=3239998 RepID=UPI003D90CA84